MLGQQLHLDFGDSPASICWRVTQLKQDIENKVQVQTLYHVADARSYMTSHHRLLIVANELMATW